MTDDKTVVQIRAPLDSIAARVDNIRHLLLAAKSVGDVTAVKDQAKAVQRMTKGIRAARDSHNECGVLVIECTARVGEELTKMEKARGGGDQRSEQRRTTGITAIPVIAEPMTLEELGISKREASHAQKIASIPREKLRAHFDQVKESGGEITTAGVLRLAGKTAPKPPNESKKKQASAHTPIDLCVMEVCCIINAAIRELSRDDAATLISELHGELDHIEKVQAQRKHSVHHA
jgi:hypothetical protein